MSKYFLILLLIIATNLYAEEPLLPAGLGNNNQMIGNNPELPAGLLLDKSVLSENNLDFKENKDSPLTFNNFLEGRFGNRIADQPYQKKTSLAEIRYQTNFEYINNLITAKLNVDFIYDNVMEYTKQDYEKGDGYIDLREANVIFRPVDSIDVKIGRQILTWGVGDLLFINDIFPKDWRAFFIGRHEEYLKAPSDAIKASFFSTMVNLDIAYMPRHDASRYLDGRRISFFSPTLMRPSGQDDPIINPEDHNQWIKEDEVAFRFYKNIGSAELALYYFNGYWKTPEGMNPITGNYIFPELQVYGASLRTTLGKGILSLELGYYDSEDDNGDKYYIRNNESRYLLSYEQEIFKNFTAAFQYYIEYMDNYEQYQQSLPAGMFIKDQIRELWTIRLTQMLMKQKLTLSLFNYYSPTDKDDYLRPKVTYKPNDHLMFELGGNIFWGEKEELVTETSEEVTFFGQLEDNNNIFLAIRYTF